MELSDGGNGAVDRRGAIGNRIGAEAAARPFRGGATAGAGTNTAAEEAAEAVKEEDEIHEARKELLLAGKDWTAAAKGAETAREASDVMREGKERMYELLWTLTAGPVSNIIDLQKGLRSALSIRLDTPGVMLVGSPNVGKSSIVQAISSGTPLHDARDDARTRGDFLEQ